MKGGCPKKLMFQKLGLGSGAYNHYWGTDNLRKPFQDAYFHVQT